MSVYFAVAVREDGAQDMDVDGNGVGSGQIDRADDFEIEDMITDPVNEPSSKPPAHGALGSQSNSTHTRLCATLLDACVNDLFDECVRDYLPVLKSLFVANEPAFHSPRAAVSTEYRGV